MKIGKSHFWYNKRQRNGIFFLLLIIVSLQCLFFFVDFSSNETNNLNFAEFSMFQKELDSLAKINNQPKTLYPFNPNFITDFKGYQLGMSIDEIDRLHNFRKKGQFVNSTAQFQRITQVNDSLLKTISSYFKFPEWVKSKRKYSVNVNSVIKDKSIEKRDINLVTADDLRMVNGIGEKLSKRIIDYRQKLQGFTYNNQLYEVWNLNKEIVDKVLLSFQVLTPPIIEKININDATFKQVLRIVYIDYELTKNIFNYLDEVAEIQNIEELKKIEGFPLEKFDRIALYLEAK
jgi:DNA uptake protein ComE-like DNA-binding protein